MQEIYKMSEHYHGSPKNLENLQESLEHKDNLNEDKEKQKLENLQEPLETIESARETIEKQAISSGDIIIEKDTEHPDHTIHYVTKHIKNERYKTSLSHIRQNLQPTQKIFSKVIHQPTIETISEVGAKTIARPSGLLGGGLVALFFSLALIILARRIGFVVPNSIFAITFVIGFCLGILVEIILSSLRKIRGKTSRN